MVYILKSDENTRGDLYDHVNPVQAECIVHWHACDHVPHQFQK